MTLTNNQKVAIGISITIVVLILGILLYYKKFYSTLTPQQIALLELSKHPVQSMNIQPVQSVQPIQQAIPQPVQAGATLVTTPPVPKVQFTKNVVAINNTGLDEGSLTATLNNDTLRDSVNQCMQMNTPSKFSKGSIVYNGAVLNDFEAQFVFKFSGDTSNTTNLYFFWDYTDIPRSSRSSQQGNQIVIHRNPDLYAVYYGDNSVNEKLFQQSLDIPLDWIGINIVCYNNVVTTTITRSTYTTVIESKLKNRTSTGSFFGIGCDSMSGGPVCQVKNIKISKLIANPTATAIPATTIQSMSGSFDSPY